LLKNQFRADSILLFRSVGIQDRKMTQVKRKAKVLFIVLISYYSVFFFKMNLSPLLNIIFLFFSYQTSLVFLRIMIFIRCLMFIFISIFMMFLLNFWFLNSDDSLSKFNISFFYSTKLFRRLLMNEIVDVLFYFNINRINYS